KAQKVKATLTAVQPPGRFGALVLDGSHITSFQENPKGDGRWINGGFFVCSRAVLDYIKGDETVWEREPLERLARERSLAAYFHRGFWQPMDTLRDKNHLEELWASGSPPWKVWGSAESSGPGSGPSSPALPASRGHGSRYGSHPSAQRSPVTPCSRQPTRPYGSSSRTRLVSRARSRTSAILLRSLKHSDRSSRRSCYIWPRSRSSGHPMRI